MRDPELPHPRPTHGAPSKAAPAIPAPASFRKLSRLNDCPDFSFPTTSYCRVTRQEIPRGRRARHEGENCLRLTDLLDPLLHLLDVLPGLRLALQAAGGHVADLAEDWALGPAAVVLAEDPGDVGV